MGAFATLDLASGNWTFDVAPKAEFCELKIGFTENSGSVEKFNQLAFGFTVVANGLPALTKTYPTEGVNYVATDQAYLTNEQVKLASDDEVVLTVWAENGGERHEASTTFTVPRPEQPYPSWVWEDDGWMWPVPYPEDGGMYAWDEESQSWVEASE